MTKTVKVGHITIGGGRGFALIAGPCVIENKQTVMRTARAIRDICARLKVPFIFKASYDKANRTSLKSFRGPGIAKGLEVLGAVKNELGVPILTDVHSPEEARRAARVADVLQIPAFLCRQTDLLVAAARTGKVVNIKKGQFLAPWDMKAAVSKVEGSKNKNILLTERGTSFGYNTLVTDFRSLAVMRGLGYPVVFDATHSVQQPGGKGTCSGGESEYVPLLSRSAIAAGCDALFLEVHPDPKKALSDGPNMLAVSQVEDLLVDLIAIDTVVKRERVPKPRKPRK